MATLARTEMLEKKIDKHMREHMNEMKTFRNELQILKTKTTTMTAPMSGKDQRSLNDGNKKLFHNSKAEQLPRNKIMSAKPLKKLYNDGKSLNNNYSTAAATADDGGDKMSNNNVNKTVSAENKISPHHPLAIRNIHINLYVHI